MLLIYLQWRFRVWVHLHGRTTNVNIATRNLLCFVHFIWSLKILTWHSSKKMSLLLLLLQLLLLLLISLVEHIHAFVVLWVCSIIVEHFRTFHLHEIADLRHRILLSTIRRVILLYFASAHTSLRSWRYISMLCYNSILIIRHGSGNVTLDLLRLKLAFHTDLSKVARVCTSVGTSKVSVSFLAWLFLTRSAVLNSNEWLVFIGLTFT